MKEAIGHFYRGVERLVMEPGPIPLVGAGLLNAF